MALFKILKGNEANLPADKHEGWAYVTEKGNMYVDLSNDKRVKIGNRADSAEFADKATGDTKPIRDIYLAKLAQVESTGSKFTFRGITGGGDNAPDLISIPLAGDLAGLVSNTAQTLKGIKTFNDGISFPEVTSTTYPAKSKGLTWSGGTDGAKIYYEVKKSDEGLLVIESTDDENTGAVFRNSNSGKEVSIINGLVTGSFKGNIEGTASNAIKDNLNQTIDETYMKYPLTISGETITMVRGDGINSTITVPDTKVTQSNTNASNYRPVVLGYTNTSTIADLSKTVRNQVYVSTKFYACPSTGVFVAPEFKGKLTGKADTAGTADYAIADGDGNNIAATYVADVSKKKNNSGAISSHYVFTVTKGDGSTNDVDLHFAASASCGGAANSANTVNVIDVRGANHLPNDSIYKDKNMQFIFNNNTMPSSDWYSGMHIAGWTRTDYQSWELVSGSSTGLNGKLYYRNGKGGSWNAWKELVFTDGTVKNAQYAEKDKDGNVITTTYIATIKEVTSNGTTFTFRGYTSDNTERPNLITIPAASTTKAGLVTNAAQTWAGKKTFTGDIIISHDCVNTMTNSSTNPYIKLGNADLSQYAMIMYTSYDSYRAPGGLKILGPDPNDPIWFEVEGDLYVKRNLYDKNGDALLADRYVASFYSHTSTASTFKLGGKNYDGDVICNHQIPNASTTVAGLITAEAQDLKGNKTLDGTFYGKADFHRFTKGQAVYRTYMPGGANRPKGWYRIAQISGLENYMVFTLFITGGYHSGSPSVAQVHITVMHRTIKIRQISGVAGLISKVRVTGNQNAYYLEVYQNFGYTAETTMAQQTFFLVGDVQATTYQPTTNNGTTGELTVECPIRSYDNTYVHQSGSANRLAYYSAIGDISSTGHYASTTQIGINMTNTTTIGSNTLYVEGISKFNGDLTVVGNVNVTKDIRMNTGGTAIYWDTGDYRQRILNTDDSTNNTDVFTFQQSSNSGSTWRNLLKIQDDGVLIVTDNTGQFRKNYASANATPAILIGSNNQDVSIWRVYSSDAAYKAAGVYGYSLKYRGTKSGQSNYLTLYADAQTATSQVIAYSIDQAGNMSIRTEVDMNYSLFVNGATKIKFRNDREIPWVSTANLNIGQSAGTLHITTNGHGSGTAIQNGNEASITFGTGDLAYAGIYSPTSGGFGNHLIFATTGEYAKGAYARMIITNLGSVGIGTMAPSYKLHVMGDIYANGGWLRTSGAKGWYSETYGGGWYMTDANFIRNYNSKAVSINIASNNAWGIGSHRLAAVFKGNDHVSILLSTNSIGYGLCINNNGNWYWGKRTTSSETSTSGDTYLLQGNTTLVRPSTNLAIGLGEIKVSEFSNAYIRAVNTRHLDASGVYSGDMNLYIGYGNNTPTQKTLFYYSTGTHGSGATSRTQFAEINSNGLYALTRFGVNGQNTNYNFYVNGTSYLGGNANVCKVYNSNNYNCNSALTLTQLAAYNNASCGMIHAATDNPRGAAGWVHVWSQAWSHGVTSSWVSQIALNVADGAGMWYRTTSGNIAGRAWIRVLDTNNYASVLDSRYVNATGDTMTGLLKITTNGVTTTYGCQNSSYSHNSTTASVGHWFNKNVYVQGNIYAGSSYSDLVLTTANYASNLDARYVNVTGDTMSGALTFNGSDSYGIFTSKNNYCSIGSTSSRFYRAYINNTYVRNYILHDSNNTQCARLYIDTVGTASTTEGTNGTLGQAYLMIGNSTAQSSTLGAGKSNSRGSIFLYGTSSYYTRIYTNNVKGNYSFILPNYGGTQYAVHTGSTLAVGSSSKPVYVAANGRVAACSNVIAQQVKANQTAPAYDQCLTYFSGQIPLGTSAGQARAGSYNNRNVWCFPSGQADENGSVANIQVLRMSWGTTYWHDIFANPNRFQLWYRAVISGSAKAWKRIWIEGNSVTGAVWNDYAECRKSDSREPGYVMFEKGDDSLGKTIERLQHFAGIVSDTWGFSQGETADAKTHIAVAGRVLAYPYRDRNEYKPGDCVCAAPGGKVDIMTREEITQYPDRIVGTVSCIPDYEEWGGGEGADRDPVKVNGRIWIKVR